MKSTVPERSPLLSTMAALLPGRFAFDVGLRAPLPFLAVIAASVGGPPEAAGWLSASLSAALLIAPLAGVLSARFGQRRLLLGSLAGFALAALLLPLASNLALVLGLFLLLGLCKALYAPQAQGVVGERVPFAQRGRAMGMFELSWAGAWILGVPMFGWLAERAGWWAGFVFVGMLALIAFLQVWRFTRGMPTPVAFTTFSLAPWREVWRSTRARWFMLFSFCIVFGTQMPYLVYPLWLKTQFGLSIEQIGFWSITIGIADLCGEMFVAAFSDRIGPRRLMLAGGVFFVLALMLWGVLSGSVAGTFVALFFVYLGYETVLVASLAVASELVPGARAAMMGWNSFAQGVSRILSSLIVLSIFGEDQRLWLVAALAACVVALGLVAVWRAR